ncbi:MAG: glycosyltransferase [Salibacteraceae bacterium]
MNLLYISFWSVNSGLSKATVLPVIQYLLKNDIAKSIILLTPESRNGTAQLEYTKELSWVPVYFANEKQLSSGWRLLMKMFFATLRALFVKRKEIDLIWARASIAGGVAAIAAKLFRKPFGVESFEPHARYMTESGAWKNGGIKHRLQNWLEKVQMKNAWRLVTVSTAYQTYLINEKKIGVAKVYNIPCCADFDLFRFDMIARDKLRGELQIADREKVGIYVGKFGDIYYDQVFFAFLERAFKQEFIDRMIFLSPMPEHVHARIMEHAIPQEKCTIKEVAHEEIYTYLSAADVGFCPVKESPAKRYCSPIKTAEYFACGLPVIISRGIGDDSTFVNRFKIGRSIDFKTHSIEINDVQALMEIKRLDIISLSREYRSVRIKFNSYKNLFGVSQS